MGAAGGEYQHRCAWKAAQPRGFPDTDTGVDGFPPMRSKPGRMVCIPAGGQHLQRLQPRKRLRRVGLRVAVRSRALRAARLPPPLVPLAHMRQQRVRC